MHQYTVITTMVAIPGTIHYVSMILSGNIHMNEMHICMHGIFV